MQELRDPLFLGVEFLNIHKKDKNQPSISVRVNLQRDDLIYAQSIKGRMEVVGYTDPGTGLFVAEAGEQEQESVYHRFRQEAVKYAGRELLNFLSRLEAMAPKEYESQDYKPFAVIANALRACLTDRQALYADLQKQVNLVVSGKFPKVNEFLVFEDSPIKYHVTERVPYKDPAGIALSEGEKAELDVFLDVFFDSYNKYVFSWYMGAALSNVPVYDDRVGKLAILSSSLGGSGKSTLATGMVNALFGPAYRDIKDDFDSFFAMNSRFGTSALSTKRICIYSEAAFNSDPLSSDHNFSGMNVSGIKSLVTEGYIATESKFQDRRQDLLSGFHLVLTNHPPVITEDNQAMNRRILPIMLRPTSMAQKARQLRLWGRQKLYDFIKQRAGLFAAYFAAVFHADEYAFCEQEYDYKDYVQDILDSQDDLDEKQREGRKKLDLLKADGLLKFIGGIEKEHGVELALLKDDIKDALGGGQSAMLMEHLRMDGGFLYLDSSKSFLLRYGMGGPKVRECLKEFYGSPVKRFHRRMFKIPMAEKP